VFYKCIDAVRAYWKEGGEGVLGLHIEGPWINPIKRGAHIESLIHSPTVNEVSELLEYGKGVIKMITLAPEVCSKEVITLIESYSIVFPPGIAMLLTKKPCKLSAMGSKRLLIYTTP
jgi:N-acetylglucosamine-6-phosphate deacetylase